ncbi:unnamed protein product [Fusarium venenatum]|uniref:CHAT domain-containing protein n=2 Tax=Fusarium venenatum TaxID=56646 RepID=A0A2L2TIU3_9HYPO|nr:uncharacterized protein FVRRES_08020 [Fusarium venenatum]CEI67943.1 unnamed protein product [Fusarium venenatum]
MPTTARALLVENERSPYLPSSQLFTSHEISELSAICRSRGLEVFQAKYEEGFLQALASYILFHFSGSFTNIDGDPLRSRFSLTKGLITVKDILEVIPRPRSPPYLAYLSSCDTSRTFKIEFANECLHAAGALYMGGFRHTIGTLGAVEDEFCDEISGRFYRAWADRGFSDDAVALCLNDVARQCRNLGIGGKFTDDGINLGDDNDDKKEMDWASFIHFGP